jgi:hypothetical protein
MASLAARSCSTSAGVAQGSPGELGTPRRPQRLLVDLLDQSRIRGPLGRPPVRHHQAPMELPAQLLEAGNQPLARPLVAHHDRGAVQAPGFPGQVVRQHRFGQLVDQ